MSATSAFPTALPTGTDRPRHQGDDALVNLYGYDPSLAAAIVYIVVFALITLVQAVQVGRSRIWWLVVLCVGGIGEIVGWAGRAWASSNAYNINAFLIQIICAAVYGLLGVVVRSIGPKYSLLKPKFYLWLFCSLDLISLIIQGIGGGMAAVALQNDESSDKGSHIMLAGICCQLVAMLVFCALGLDVYRRARADRSYRLRPHPQQGRLTAVSWGLAFSSFWILLRCCYRVAELAEGWEGYLIRTEPYFCVLDSMAMVFAQGIFIFTWPNNEKGFHSKTDETLPRTSSDSPNTREDGLDAEKQTV
ncbi:hypothetical protein JCM10213v2_003176 [Rhodosporidiobolus nylandii]